MKHVDHDTPAFASSGSGETYVSFPLSTEGPDTSHLMLPQWFLRGVDEYDLSILAVYFEIERNRSCISTFEDFWPKREQYLAACMAAIGKHLDAAEGCPLRIADLVTLGLPGRLQYLVIQGEVKIYNVSVDHIIVEKTVPASRHCRLIAQQYLSASGCLLSEPIHTQPGKKRMLDMAAMSWERAVYSCIGNLLRRANEEGFNQTLAAIN